MKPFERFLTLYSLMRDADQLEMSQTMAYDPEVAKYCNIQSDYGSFLGIPIKVVPDVRRLDFKKTLPKK